MFANSEDQGYGISHSRTGIGMQTMFYVGGKFIMFFIART